jgi:hypothetical protein
MNPYDIILLQRNSANTAIVRRTLFADPFKTFFLATVNGNPSFLELLDSNGNISLNLIPKAAQPDVVVVADAAARLALTEADVQNGDVVFQDDEAKPYYVVDSTQLSSAAGYKTLQSLSFNWNDIQGKPSNIAQHVAVPASSTAAGEPGQFATDADNLYVYVGDGTTHKWLQFAGNTF